jgi:hypothetical protein
MRSLNTALFTLWLAMTVMAALLLGSCGKKKEAAPAETAPEVTSVQLNPGFGAMLIIFPKNAAVSAANFHATALLFGDTLPSDLQRYPFGDLQALLVTAILPARYRVIGQALVTVGSPYAGGRIDSLRIPAGQITVLMASLTNGDHLPFHNTHLHFVKQVPWTYKPPQKLADYLAGIIRESTRE